MTISGITLRTTKGSELTFAELDANFTNLSNAITGLFTSTVTITGLNETVYNWGNVSGTVTPNASTATVHKMTLTGNLTINAFASPQTGSNITLILTQDATGGRSFSSTAKFSGGYKSLTTSTSATDIISLFYDGTTYWGSISKDFS
jgi:hypothetical protein